MVSMPAASYAVSRELISSSGTSTSGRCLAWYRLMAAASFGVIGTRRDFFPLAPPSHRTRSSTRPRSTESSIRSGRPSGPSTASPASSEIRTPDPTRMRTARSCCGKAGLHDARICRSCAMW